MCSTCATAPGRVVTRSPRLENVPRSDPRRARPAAWHLAGARSGQGARRDPGDDRAGDRSAALLADASILRPAGAARTRVVRGGTGAGPMAMSRDGRARSPASRRSAESRGLPAREDWEDIAHPVEVWALSSARNAVAAFAGGGVGLVLGGRPSSSLSRWPKSGRIARHDQVDPGAWPAGAGGAARDRVPSPIPRAPAEPVDGD